MTRDELAEAMHPMNSTFINPCWLARRLLSRSRYKNDMCTWFLIVSALVSFNVLRQRLNPFRPEHYQQLLTPEWYEG